MKHFIYILLCLLTVSTAKAQSVYNDHIRIENLSVTRSNDNRLTVAMDIVLQPNMKVTSNQASTFTPLLKTSTYNKVLPSIVIYGRRRQLVNTRNRHSPKDALAIVRRENKKQQRINYLIQLPYEAWMQRAALSLDLNVSGCCNGIEQEMAENIYQLNIEPAKPQPHIAYITPNAEPIKHRATVGKAFLDFPVNQTAIYPDYRKNSAELDKIRATIDTVRNDRNTSITSILIEGFASPEGNYASNARLAEARTQSLMQYVRNYYSFDDRLLKMASTPEDWAGFRSFIEASNLHQKYDILQIIDNNQSDYDLKEKNIARLMGPEQYKFILNECYPALRHSDYTVSYTVRGFTVEEAKDIIKKRPHQLSLQEIFNVAQTYEKGSNEFNHAFQVAVLMFPDDPIANLNAAAMEIQKGGNLTDAKKHLEKSEQEHPATLNNWGVIALMEGDFKRAEEYFKKSKQITSKENEAATSNLLEVTRLLNYPTE